MKLFGVFIWFQGTMGSLDQSAATTALSLWGLSACKQRGLVEVESTLLFALCHLTCIPSAFQSQAGYASVPQRGGTEPAQGPFQEEPLQPAR